ncbi:cysteine hydrolase family protein [Chelatococcus reniformis]|uniref:Peroxyureidoacrylate/ureidoacrylate amidohydrolase RutB n=1 Tax=Chelatococcus reniformis TaxID=1494448 RepID=A0A916TZK6_9HYPH|nr:cysteine hydrolase [Chelatococcus reniformis]GGC54215.1 peroxyureidoacrylate/ureidoacrylate amidohydrolase RutB [Chelatococcus reniformis]
MSTTAMAKAAPQPDVDRSRLGTGAYAWKVSPTHVDLSMPPPVPLPATIAAEPQTITVDLARSAMIVVDMQNDFCAPGGWVDWLGADLSPERAPIKPLQRLLPALRARGVPIIWLNWGNRADRKNLPPTTLYVFNPDGNGIGLGEPLPNGSLLLEKDSWSAAVVDELEQLPGDIKVDKFRISGFWDTPLDSILKNLEVKTLFFAGVNTDQCVLHSLTDAHFLGYNCVLVEDCCGTTSPDYCREATIWNVKRCFGFVTDTDKVVAGLP